MAGLKRITIIFFALCILGTSEVFSQTAEAEGQIRTADRPRVGLVLSGGGARGAAHVGVLKVLKEMRIPIDAVAGTSMGAVVGGLYAAGLEPDELERVVKDIDWQDAFRDRTGRESLSFRRKQDDIGYLVKFDLGFNHGELQLPKGIIQGQKLSLILRALTLPVSHIEDFDELATPFRAVAADLRNGDAVVLGEGDLVLAMRASMSAPGIFSPVEVDGRTLVDGGIAKNIPIDVGRAMGVDTIIAVDVGFPLRPSDELESAVAIADQMLTILIRREAEGQIASLKPRDILLEPAIGNYSSTNFAEVADVIAPGEASALAASSELARLRLDENDYAEFVASRQLARRAPGAPAFVRVKGDSPLSPRVISSRLEYQAGQPIDPELIAEDVSNIYGLELFEQVDYSLVEENGEVGLEYRTVARSWGPNYLRFGLSFEEDFEGANEFNVGARYIRTAVNPLGAEWRTDLQIGTNPRLFSEFYQPLSFDLRYFISPELLVEQRNIDVFENAEPFARFRFTSAQIGLSGGRELGNSGEVRVGVRRSSGNARLKIGDESLPNADFDSGSYFLSLRRDTLDDPQFPRAGTALGMELEFERPELGSDTHVDLITANWTKVRSFERNTFAFGLKLATSSNGVPTLQDLYSLGGFLNLSGLDSGQIRGPHAGVARIIYYRQLTGSGGSLFDWPMYIGTSLEAGNVWQTRDEVSLDSLVFSGSAFIGLDTFFGPLFFATGLSEDGDSTFYLFLGAPFR